MEEYKREEFPMISKIYHIIVENHKPANHTLDILLKNKDVTNFCEVARHFIEIPYPKKSILVLPVLGSNSEQASSKRPNNPAS
jgi:hypothetical protein